MQSKIEDPQADFTGPDALRAGQVVIHTVAPEETTDEEAAWIRENCLPQEESRRAARFYSATDRHEYIVSRALLRLGLSPLFTMSPANLCFSRNQHGQPYVAAENSHGIHFSLAHTRGLVALLVTRAGPAGVDVEKVSARSDLGLVAEGVFSPTELVHLNRLSGPGRTTRFFELWTLKEAYSKARGLGLALPFRSAGFNIRANRQPEASFAPEIHDRPELWQFWSQPATTGHLIAAAVRVEPGQKCALSFRAERIGFASNPQNPATVSLSPSRAQTRSFHAPEQRLCV